MTTMPRPKTVKTYVDAKQAWREALLDKRPSADLYREMMLAAKKLADEVCR